MKMKTTTMASPILAGLLALLLSGGTAAAQETAGDGQVFAEALTLQNPLAQRYYMKVPQLIHVSISDRDEKFTVSRGSSGALRQVPGHYGEPFLSLNPSSEQLGQVYEAVADGTVTFEEKLKLAQLYSEFGEKPFQPPKTPAVDAPSASYLTSFESRLLKISNMSKKMRWLFNKTATAPNQVVKLYYGAQIRIMTPISEMISRKATELLAEEVTADIDRGQVEVSPGSLLDQFIGLVGMHVMMKDEDMGSFSQVIAGVKQRLQADALSLGFRPGASGLATPPPGGNAEDHEAALKKRLEAITKLDELVQTGP